MTASVSMIIDRSPFAHMNPDELASLKTFIKRCGDDEPHMLTVQWFWYVQEFRQRAGIS